MKNKLINSITSLRQFAKARGITMPKQKDIMNEAMTKVLRKYKVIGKKTHAKDIFQELR